MHVFFAKKKSGGRSHIGTFNIAKSVVVVVRAAGIGTTNRYRYRFMVVRIFLWHLSQQEFLALIVGFVMIWITSIS